jgi:hypothetical protein
MDLLARILRPSGPTHASPLFLSFESRRLGTHDTKTRQSREQHLIGAPIHIKIDLVALGQLL